MNLDHYFQYVLAAILVITLIEIVFALIQKKEWNLKDSSANLGVYVGTLIFDRLLSNILGGTILSIIAQYSVASIKLSVLSGIFLLLWMDFTYYWKHRWEHEIRALWAHHSVHHSSNHFNLSTSLRVGWFGHVYGWIYFIPPVLMGFDVILVLVTYKIILVSQYWVHSGSIGKLGFLENMINTPSNHRVHHGSDAKYIDKNYGGILIIWDKLLGTYQAEEETPTYGLVKKIELYNPFKIVLHEPLNLIKDMASQDSLKNAFLLLIKEPGWMPAEGAKDDHILIEPTVEDDQLDEVQSANG